MIGKMAPPLRREELLPQLVTEADGFTVLRYLRQREEAPALWDLENAGARKLPGTPAVLADTYEALWSSEVGIKSEESIRPDRRYWRSLLEQTVASSLFQELHGKTEGSSLLSFVGTIEAGQTLLGLVPMKDQEKLRELSQASEQADELEDKAEAAEGEVEAMEQLAEQMMATAQGKGANGGVGSSQSPAGGSSGQSADGDGEGEGASGAPGSASGQLTATQAQFLAEQLAEKWDEAQSKAEIARAQADAAKAKAKAMAQALMGKPGSADAEAKLTELKRLGMGVVQAAGRKVTEIASTIQCWGLEEGELNRMEFPEAIGLLEKMRRSEAFKKFAVLLGRLRAVAAKKAKSKVAGEGQKVARQETGRDLNRAFPAELAALTHPSTRVQTLIRWARGELRLRAEESRRPLGHGPVVVCEDASASMDGAKQQWAKGTTLALAHFAKLRQRSFGWVLFDAYVHQAKTYPKGQLSAQQMLEVAESRAGGGTDFDRPLRRAVQMIEEEGLTKADVVLVTDGDCAVSTEFLQWLGGKKKQLDFSVITVLCDSGDHVSDATVKQFSERVERVSAFSAEEAETKVFVHL